MNIRITRLGALLASLGLTACGAAQVEQERQEPIVSACPSGGVPSASTASCAIRVEDCCYEELEHACVAAGCEAGCTALETAPAQVQCDAQGLTATWTVAAERVDCVGVGPMRCMRVQEGEGADWTLFYDSIEGLDAQEGTRYVVEVRIHLVPDPPADGSSRRVELVRILSESVGESPDGQCASSNDCPDGQMCAGPEGCATPWTCQPARACTRDLQPYCTCDGRTVRGSGSCPPEPYVARGACAP